MGLVSVGCFVLVGPSLCVCLVFLMNLLLPCFRCIVFVLLFLVVGLLFVL